MGETIKYLCLAYGDEKDWKALNQGGKKKRVGRGKGSLVNRESAVGPR